MMEVVEQQQKVEKIELGRKAMLDQLEELIRNLRGELPETKNVRYKE